ncbi:hypothetical protein ACJIZ3_001836 [Penstemon smallii]|uniref:Uncharacterized protein n=1 Tax=Penstemon smallii TaxID=265156 RepID=A0ABD3U794_9LAMI
MNSNWFEILLSMPFLKIINMVATHSDKFNLQMQECAI